MRCQEEWDVIINACVLEGLENGREHWVESCVCVGSCGTTHVAGLFFPERTFGKDSASRDLSFAIWGPERREQCQVCSVLTLLALRTSLAISTMGQEACRGLWTQNAPQCQLCVCGLLVVVLIECIALEKGYKHSAFATNIILSSTVRVGAGPLVLPSHHAPCGPALRVRRSKRSPCVIRTWVLPRGTLPLVLVAQEGRASGGRHPFFWLENMIRPVLSQVPLPLEQTMLCRICFRIWVAFTAVK